MSEEINKLQTEIAELYRITSKQTESLKMVIDSFQSIYDKIEALDNEVTQLKLMPDILKIYEH
jgi:dynactin complex subunit